MPAYNSEQFIADAIASVLQQTYPHFELIVINDGSVDRTGEIVAAFQSRDKRVKLFTRHNCGPGATMNFGLDQARSEWIFVMHSDDIMLPHRLERQLHFVQQHPKLVVASSYVYNIDAYGNIIGVSTSRLLSREAVDQVRESGELIGFHHPAVVLRKSVVQRLGGYREDLRTNEDIELWNRVADNGHLVLVQPEILLKYRIHAHSASVKHARLVQLQLRWVKQSANARRNRKSELSWKEFMENRRRRALWCRIAEEKRDLAKILYKGAVHSYSKRDYLGLCGRLMVALTLQPSYVLRQIRSKYIGARVKD